MKSLRTFIYLSLLAILLIPGIFNHFLLLIVILLCFGGIMFLRWCIFTPTVTADEVYDKLDIATWKTPDKVTKEILADGKKMEEYMIRNFVLRLLDEMEINDVVESRGKLRKGTHYAISLNSEIAEYRLINQPDRGRLIRISKRISILRPAVFPAM